MFSLVHVVSCTVCPDMYDTALACTILPWHIHGDSSAVVCSNSCPPLMVLWSWVDFLSCVTTATGCAMHLAYLKNGVVFNNCLSIQHDCITVLLVAMKFLHEVVIDHLSQVQLVLEMLFESFYKCSTKQVRTFQIKSTVDSYVAWLIALLPKLLIKIFFLNIIKTLCISKSSLSLPYLQ